MFIRKKVVGIIHTVVMLPIEYGYYLINGEYAPPMRWMSSLDLFFKHFADGE